MALNPDCTPGWATGVKPNVTAHCGCGWAEPGFASRRKALRAQKDHRFPPRMGEGVMREGTSVSAARRAGH